MDKCYIHHIPGRLRIRIPTLRNNPQEIERVRNALAVEGTTTFNANPLTGSVIVTYDVARLSHQRLLEILKTNGVYCENRVTTMDAQLRKASHTAARKASRAMFSWAVGRILEANGLSFIAAFI